VVVVKINRYINYIAMVNTTIFSIFGIVFDYSLDLFVPLYLGMSGS
jgi:hypothetical protein